MESPFNISLSQAQDDFLSLFNNLIASGTANTDEIENADFSGLPPESCVPSFPTRHAKAQQPSLVNGEIIEKESQVWNPCSTLTTEDPSSEDVAPQSSTVPAAEDENYFLDLELLSMPDLGTTYDACDPFWDQLPLLISDLNERSNEIVESVSENHFMEDDVVSLLNNLIGSGTTNTDEIENAEFSGLPPESSVPSSPTRHANSQQPSLVNGEIIGKDSQVWNPNSTLPPLSTCPSALTTKEPSLDDVAPQSSTVPATEDENYFLDLERSNEIFGGVSKNHFMVGQSQQIDYPSSVATTDEPSCEATAPTNTTVLAIENGQSTSICQPILPFDWQMMASPLAFPAVGCPPSTSYWPLGLEFYQNDSVHLGAFDGSSTSIRQSEEYYFMEEMESILKDGAEPRENINFRYQEVDHGKKRRKPNDGRRWCGCKKSKCIQRYCECFSSGFYCEETCGCKGCDNIIEQGALVLNKRKEIERRNALAFAPKIVPLHQEEDSELPGIRLSGRNKRHKRGRSCTKSKCLQKYCECYQANVKCLVTCRCKGCGNMDTHEHDSGPTNFMIGEAMNNNVNIHRFNRNDGEMLPQPDASNNNFGPQASLSSSSSSVLPLQQWPPRESTSFGNSVSFNPTFGPRPLPPLIPNDSRLSVRVNSPDRKRVPPPRFPVPEVGPGMSTPYLPPLIPPQ